MANGQRGWNKGGKTFAEGASEGIYTEIHSLLIRGGYGGGAGGSAPGGGGGVEERSLYEVAPRGVRDF